MADADTKVIGPFYVFAPDKVTTTSHGDKRTTTPFTSDDQKKRRDNLLRQCVRRYAFHSLVQRGFRWRFDQKMSHPGP
jgi:hypothetical protein